MHRRSVIGSTQRQQGKALTITLSIFVVLLLIVLLLPTLLSTGPGTRMLLGMVDRSVPGEVQIESLSLGWFTGQRLTGVRVFDPDDEQVISLAEMRTEMTLLQAARRQLSLGETRLIDLVVDLRVNDAGELNLNRALGLGEADPEEPPGQLAIPVTGNMILENGRVTWSTPGMEPVAVEDLQIQVRLDQVTRALDFRLDGISQMPGGTGNLHARGELRDWINEAGEVRFDTATLDARARLEELPLQIVDGLAGLDGLLLEALGDRITIMLDGTEQDLELLARSPHLDLELAASLQDMQLRLQEPGSLRWQLRPQVLARLLPQDDSEAPLQLREPVDLRLTLERLDLPLRGFDPQNIALRGTFANDQPLRWQGGGLDGLEIRNLGAEVSSDSLAQAIALTLGADVLAEERSGELRVDASLSDLFASDGSLQQDTMVVDVQAALRELPTALLDRLGGMDGLLVAALGSRLNLQAEARTEAAGRIDAVISANSEHLESQPIRLVLDDRIRLQEAARIRYQLRPELLQHLAPEAAMRLTGGSRIELNLHEFSAPMPAEDTAFLQPERMQVRADLTSGTLELEDEDGTRHRLEALRTELGGESLADIALNGSARLTQSETGILHSLAAAPFDLQWRARTGLTDSAQLRQIVLDLNGSGGELRLVAPLQIAGDFSRIEMRSPVELDLPMRSDLHPAAPELIGALLSVVVDGAIDLGETTSGSLGVRLSSDHLQGNMGLQLGETLRLQRPAEFQWRITPAAHAALQAEAETPRLLLEAPTTLTAVVSRLVMPLGEPMTGRMPDVEASLELADSRLRMEDSERRYRMRDLLAEVNTASSGTAVNVRMDGRVSEVDGEAGELNLQARVADLFTGEAGAFDMAGMALDLDARLNALPVPVLDSFMGMEGLLTATLGRQVDGRAHGELRAGNGPIEVNLRSPNARIEMRASAQDGVLGLRDAMVAEIQPTEEFGKTVLARVHPIFETLRGGEQPIRLTIPAQGVALPLTDFAIERVSIPELDLRLGELELASGWLLQGLVTLGQRFGQMRSVGDRWRAEFTPAILGLSDGKLEYKRRLDVMLGDQLHLSTWGTVDMAAERMDLVLGIMPTTLASVFRIEVPENEALRIPVRGQGGTGAIDFSRAGSELVRLQAQRRLGGSNPLLGALAGAVSGSSPGMTGAPQPSVSPLPWAERLQRQAEAAREAARKEAAEAE